MPYTYVIDGDSKESGGDDVIKVRRITYYLVTIFVVILAISSCANPGRYTSLDLALLPCEYGDQPKFFNPIEFKSDGSLLYPEQKDHLINDIQKGKMTDLIVFIHGWNKNPVSAELDYQNFICRLHAKLPLEERSSKRIGNWKVVGVFWPSTISNKAKEPLLIKPVSYYKIRNRVDHLAEAGLAVLLKDISDLLIDMDTSRRNLAPDNRIRLHLIGHSFGGRMIIRSFKKLSDDGDLVPMLEGLEATNMMLLNAAAPPSYFEWISGAVAKAWKLEQPARFTSSTSSYLLNIHSNQDLANKVLFRIASAFNDDEQSCAVGACGVPDYPTICVDMAGKLIPPDQDSSQTSPDINIVNIDSTKIVFDHSDIYKGRVANLVSDLLYDETSRAMLKETTKGSDCTTQ